MITVRKFKLTVVGNEEERNSHYKWIRQEMYNQYRGLNALMSFMVSNALLNQFEGWEEYKLKTDIAKAKKKKIGKKEIAKLEKQYAEASKERTNFADKFYDTFLKNSY